MLYHVALRNNTWQYYTDCVDSSEELLRQSVLILGMLKWLI